MSNQSVIKKNKIIKIAQFILILLIVALGIWFVNQVGIEQIRSNVEKLGIWATVAVFALRFTSVVVPALPGTAYSVFAGGLLGFVPGLITICLADIISCSLSFLLSRHYGRDFIQKIVGKRFITRIDNLSQKNLENNFFLMTAFLMTGFFDFVCYGVGLTKTPWQKFIPALLISIGLSNPPIVALGAGILESGKLLLGFALLGVFLLGVMTAILKRKQKI
ncbi:conserved membrane hypothetical protein [Hyella patelloides LEGE 07179]|uniref:TVP38/TMEM64 family membrane protein n=1 Tax=Hyella patelloides LEGE 07179 TaxID=945734 RepID=A0A563VVG7_9CYAN|nr:VTT domain-containing protein [Hyella patelloides]VEP15395.1 conserved membrane hypothetical protein [Hyella patelloides LEGE 07179]